MELSDLRGIFLFEGLADDRLRDLIEAGTEVAFEPGDVLFREGDPADHWWMLVDGHLELLRRSGHQESAFATIDTPGQWAGGFRAWSDTPG